MFVSTVPERTRGEGGGDGGTDADDEREPRAGAAGR